MRSHESLVDLQIGWTAAQALDIDTPLFWIEMESLQCSLLACELDGVNVLVATIVSRPWVSFRVFVAHGRSKGIEDST